MNVIKLASGSLVLFAIWLTWTCSRFLSLPVPSQTIQLVNRESILSQCRSLKAVPRHVDESSTREQSDRFEAGTNATWIRNCTIFTGEQNGTIIIHGDLLLDKGIVKEIGKISGRVIENTPNLTIVEANGAWITPGLVDIHSHLGILSAPILSGAMDLDSTKGPILPWLRSVDGLNTHDESYQLAIAGGVTSAQVLPGSNNAIAGQSFFIKLRKTSDHSALSMIVEPPFSLTGSDELTTPVRWRHMKQACGENLAHYGNRMDNMWALRSAYHEARKIMVAQDSYCAKAESGLWGSINEVFPENLQWEMLVDVLRGKVKISNHCSEAVDLDAMVRLTNEFKFPIASFHHAAEAWLVPKVLKRAWGGIPAIAMLATNYRFRREAFRGSEYAPRVLADEGIPVVMKSDHPVTNSRYLAYEAQQAHYFGLQSHLALASMTSTPAAAVGLAHRIGILKKGADADVVLWDSHPLQLGATPVNVWIDGIHQTLSLSKHENNPVEVGKGKEGEEWKQLPQVPNWDKERQEAIEWEGLPPLHPRNQKQRVIFTNVRKVWTRTPNGTVEEIFGGTSNTSSSIGHVLVEGGRIHCIGSTCSKVSDQVETIDLRGGSISPGLMSYGSPLGLGEIVGETSTSDGGLYDALKGNVPNILNDIGGVVRAMDALMFETRDALTAYRSGVTMATTSLAKPIFLGGPSSQFLSGLSTTFRTGSGHAMEQDAIIQDVAGLHVVLGRSHPLMPNGISVSTQIATLRRLLYGWESRESETGGWFRKAAEGVIPLVLEVDNADIMASLLILKSDVENRIGSRMRMVFAGATEAHLLAREIGNADVGVILTPARPFPMVWDQRRILPGPPVTNDTALVSLLGHGVIVGLGIRSSWEARHARFDIQWAALESNGRIKEREAYALVTTDLERLLGIRGIDDGTADLIAFEGGGMFDLSSKVVGVISPLRKVVELF